MFNDEIQTDVQFFSKLLEEENVFVLPGEVFGMAEYFRIVTCPPQEVLAQALSRMKEFCIRYQREI